MKTKLITCLAALTSLCVARADLSSFEETLVEAQRAHVAKLTPPSSEVNAVLTRDVALASTREFATRVLPVGLSVVPDSEALVMDDEHAKMGRLRLVSEDGSAHLFTAWVTRKVKRPFCWAAEGYPVQKGANLDALGTFLQRTGLVLSTNVQYLVRGVSEPVSDKVVVKGSFSKKIHVSPFPRAYVLFVDDRPMANWGHPCRYVFVKDDLSAFAVWYATEPMKAELDGVEIPLEEFGGTVEPQKAPTLPEMRRNLEKMDEAAFGNAAERNLVFSGDKSHSYAVLISGGWNRDNNHTRYWGDVAAVYGTLTRKYGLPKDNIYVCMSDGTSSAADIASSSSSHTYFYGNSSPLDLDGDGAQDVYYSATISSVKGVFSKLRNRLGSSDQLFVFVTDHGSQDDYGNDTVCFWNEEEMSPSEFAALTKGIPCPVGFAFEFCYAGGFIPVLTSSSQGGPRAVASAASDETSSAWSETSQVTGVEGDTGLYYMDPWVYYFVGAMRGWFPQVNTTPYYDSYYSCTSADADGNDRVSLREASNYARARIRADGYDEMPTFGESSSGVGDAFFLVKRESAPPAPTVTSITFGKNGGSGGTSSVSATYGSSMPSITPPTRSGYRFDGYWDTLNSGGVRYYYADGSSARSWDKRVSTTTLYAKWVETVVVTTVSFGKNGGSGGTSSVSATYGSPMPGITPPTRQWYRFEGYWDTLNAGGVRYYNANGSSARNWDKRVSAATLYAKWTAVVTTTSITFGKNGGSGGTGSVTATYGSSMPRITPPARAGYSFGGYWDTLNVGGVRYYNADGSSARGWDKRASSAVLYAKWTAKSYRITLGKNGGSGGDDYVTVTYGAWPHDVGVPKRTGYVFGGYWTSTGSGGVQYYGASGKATRAYGIAGNATLWAKWSAVSYRITFGKNGGSGGDSYVTVAYGATPHDIGVPKRAGYVFGGYWTSTGSGGVQYYGASGKATRAYGIAGNATLWAKWTAASYRITFGKNGGTGGDDYVTAAYGVKPHDIGVPKKSGYVFGGYWTSTGSGGIQYYSASGKATRAYDLTSGVGLWAKWTALAVNYRLTLNKNGGTGGDDYVTVSYGVTPHDVRVPTKKGSTFAGYWTSCGASGVQYFNASGRATRAFDKKASTTLFAKWTNKLTFGKNGGAGGDAYVTAVYGQVPHAITPPTKPGYVFDGYWTTTGTGGTQYFTADGTGAKAWGGSANATLWAKWVAGTGYKVTFGLNGGTGGAYVYAVKGKAMPKITPPTRTGYTFAGYWTTTGAGGVKYYNANGTSARNFDKTKAIVLYAKWTRTSSCERAVEGVRAVGVAHAIPCPGVSASVHSASKVLTGLLADGSGAYSLLVDENGETGFVRIEMLDGAEFSAEVEMESTDDGIVLVTEDGDSFMLAH